MATSKRLVSKICFLALFFSFPKSQSLSQPLIVIVCIKIEVLPLHFHLVHQSPQYRALPLLLDHVLGRLVKACGCFFNILALLGRLAFSTAPMNISFSFCPANPLKRPSNFSLSPPASPWNNLRQQNSTSSRRSPWRCRGCDM